MTSPTLPRFVELLSHGVAVVLMALLLVGVPDASALSSTGPEGPPSLTDHLRTELRSTDADRQDRALSDVVALASCTNRCTVSLQSAEDRTLRVENEADVGRAFNLEALVPDLLTVYRDGPTRGHRLLALSALVNIGDAQALEMVVEAKTEQPPSVEAATNRTLAAYYLEEYPELAESTLQAGRLSIEDVRRAQAARLTAEGPQIHAEQ
jgi:hypothetical protein